MDEIHVSIIIFYDKKKRILMQGRKYISKRGEEWGFFGGKIELGETPEQALKREIKEELSYELKEFRFFKKYGPEVYGDVKRTYSVFIAPVPFLSEFNQVEGDSMRLFSIKEARKLKMVDGDDVVLKDLQEFFGL